MGLNERFHWLLSILEVDFTLDSTRLRATSERKRLTRSGSGGLRALKQSLQLIEGPGPSLGHAAAFLEEAIQLFRRGRAVGLA